MEVPCGLRHTDAVPISYQNCQEIAAIWHDEDATTAFMNDISDLPLGALATAFGLLKMPKMPELKNRKIVGFKADKGADLNSIKYK